MRSSKSRSRNKNRNRPQGGGNIVNRVFDSSGPEGKVRGTPAQIIEKYGQLARDAQLSGDRVALENFQQHSEHYTRMLAAAQKEIDARQGQGGQNPNQNNQQNAPQQGNQQGGYQGGQNGNSHNNGAQNGGGQNGGQHSGNQNGGSQNGQGGSEPRPPQENRPQNESRPQHEPRPQDETRGPVEQPREPRVNRRRERNADVGKRDPQTGGGADVVDMPERDSSPVETPENASPEPRAEKPRRTRTRKKAPAAPDAGDAGPPARADDPAA